MARWVAWPRLWARMANLGMAAWLCLAFVLTASAACAQDGTFTGVSKNGYIRIGRDVICHPKFVDPTGTAKDYADCQRLSPGVAAKTRKLYRMPANAPLLPDGRTLEARIVTPKGARLAEAQATVYDRRERDEPDALYTDMDAAGSVIDLAMACTDCHLELWAGDELLVRWLEGPSVEHVERLAPLPSAKAVVVQFRYRTVFSGYGSAVAFDLSKHPMWLQARRPRRCRGLAPNCGAAGVRWSLFHGARHRGCDAVGDRHSPDPKFLTIRFVRERPGNSRPKPMAMGAVCAPDMGADQEVQVLPQAGHSERSKPQSAKP